MSFKLYSDLALVEIKIKEKYSKHDCFPMNFFAYENKKLSPLGKFAFSVKFYLLFIKCTYVDSNVKSPNYINKN